MKLCPICKKEFSGHGHNPWPVTSMIQPYVGGECCDGCNEKIVTPTRQLFDGIWHDIAAKVMEARAS